MLRLFICILFLVNIAGAEPIDRKALVNRHNPVITEINTLSPFSVGNGEFAYTADVTGLQTFPDTYKEDIPLGTLSDWGWHTIPSKENYELHDAFKSYDFYGRDVPYASETKSPAGQWLRANPHKLHLGQIGFHLPNSNADQITHINQKLDLWKGVLESAFQIKGQKVQVLTLCHPKRDMIAVRVESKDSLSTLPVAFRFPYGAENWGPTMTDWDSPDSHETIILDSDEHSLELKRILDNDTYFVRIQFSNNCKWKQVKPHTILLTPQEGESFEFICEFSSKRKNDSIPSFSKVMNDCVNHWETFWTNGGAVDLGESSDPRAKELERRIVLSQYLTAIQCASKNPPQESGLTHNSWFGKFHLEMHWWHSVHFALWNRLPMLEKSLPWYSKILPRARNTAKIQGYKGARWPKMIGWDGRESPSGIGVFLIWQQPHPIYYAELCYRANPTKESLNTYKDIVFETAEFMASYAHWDENKKRYILGPPLIPAQECYPPKTTFNPTYELAYWQWGLNCAQQWKKRLGLKPDTKWQHVIEHLSPLPVNNNVYVTSESTPDTFENPSLRRDHPSLVAALGILPDSEMVDRETMRKTLHKIFEDWDWESTWGWDYPMLAMTAARVGEPELAIQSLLMDTPKNHYMPNGHCYLRKNLPTYLPANGGLLTAIAMMAAGWDNHPEISAPGFPKDGKWVVKWENLRMMP
jgi:hypothetical protein